MNAEEEEEEEEETQRKRRALINGFSSSFEGRRDDIAKRVELFRRDTEEEEEEEEEHHHNNREFTNALREALRDVSSTMNKREEDKKEENCLTSLSSKKSIATQTERNVKRIMNKRLERVKKMTDYVAVASWGGGGGKSFSVEDDDTRRLCHDARMMMEEKKKRLKPGSAASTRRITKPLKDWMYENVHHPYPSRNEKMSLSRATGMSPGQISNWCINFRGRKMRPLVREFVEEARKVAQ